MQDKKYYRLSQLNKEYNINTLHAVLLAADENRLFSKYSKLIANNKKRFIYWYIQAHKKMGENMVIIALLAIKADLAKEQSILIVRELLEGTVTTENERNLKLFYSSPYHVRVNALRYHPYYKWDDYLINENSLNYHDVTNVYAEIIDTEIVNYRGKTSVADIFEERSAQLGNDILYKRNFYANVNVLSYRLHLLYGIEYNLYNSTDNDTINYLINYPWQMRRRVKGRKYTLMEEFREKKDEIGQADSEKLVYYGQGISNLLLRNIAMYGLNIPLGLLQKIMHEDGTRVKRLRMITILGFNLSIKVAYGLDEIQMLTLICTGVLVDYITGAKLHSNFNLIWQTHFTLYRVTRFSPLPHNIPDHKLPVAPLVNNYMLYLPVHTRIANKVMLYIHEKISATALMSHFAVNNYCLIKDKRVLNWEEANLDDIMNTLQLLWSRTDDELHLNDQDISILGDWSRREEIERYVLNMELMEFGDVANLLQLDSKELAEERNIANIYNRADMIRTVYGKENYFRRNFYERGDGQIYNLETYEDLHYPTPSEMAQAINLTNMKKADVAMLSIIDAFDLLNNPDLWQKFKHDLNLDWSISKIANI